MQLREHEGVKGKRDAYPFDPRLLKVADGYNIRDLDAPEERPELDELKTPILANGVQTPLIVRLIGEDVFIVAGHRRHKAVTELIGEGVEIDSVLVIQENKGTNDADRDLNLITSNSGKPLTMGQKAVVVRRLLAHQWDEAKIAARTGLHRGTIANCITLLSTSAEVQGMVKRNEVSATDAIKETRESGPEAATETLREATKAAKDEGRTKATRKTINKTKGNTPRPRQTAMPLVAAPDRQGMINVVREATRLAILANVKDKPDDEMVSVPASFLKAARDVHLNVPPASKAPTPSPETSGDAEPAREAMSPGVAPAPVLDANVMAALVDLTKHASHVLQVNRSDECPGGFWTQEFASAVRTAERLIAQCGGNGRDPFDKTFAAIDDMKTAAEVADA